MKPNWHKFLVGALPSLAATAPMLPLPWSVVVAALATGAAAVLVRPGRVSRRMDRLSRAIPGENVADKQLDAHGAEIAGLIERSRALTGEQRER